MSYESVVLADSPTLLWLLQETSGTTAADATGNGNPGTYTGGYTQGAAGPAGVAANAVTLDGSTGYINYPGSGHSTPSITTECWFKTTTSGGGGIMVGAGTNFVVYMTDDGKVNFGTWSGSATVVCTSGSAYNDGNWHYLAATYDNSTFAQELYIDGVPVANTSGNTSGVGYVSGSGVWEAGNGVNTVTNWPGTSTSEFLAGTFCAAAVYPAALTGIQVIDHYVAGGGVAIQYNTGAAAATSNVTSQAFTIPNTGGLQGTGVMADDVMLLDVSVFTEDSTQPSIAFSGGGGTWQLVPMTDGSANPQLSAAGAIYSYVFAYQRVATAADIGATVTVTETGSPSGTTWMGVAMAAYTGANPYNPVDRAGGATPTPATYDSVTLPTETARIAGDWAVYMAGGGFNISSTTTPPAGTVQRQSALNGGGTGAAIADSNGATGLSSVGGGQYTNGAHGSAYLSGFTICLAPAGIYVVQTQTGNAGTITFGADVTAGNTVFLVPIMYGSTDPTSSNVELGGSAVPGTSLLQHVNDTTDCSHDIWMLPNCPGGQTTVTFSVNHNLDSDFVYEVAGLGPNPVADQVASSFVAFGGTAEIVGAGPTPPTTYAPEFVIGAAADYDGGINLTSPSGWTAPTSTDTGHGWSGYQVLDSSGATPSFAVNNFGDYAWTAGIVTVAPGSGAGGGTTAGSVAAVSVAAPAGTASVTTAGAVASVAVAAPLGAASVTTPGSVASVAIAALLGTISITTAGSVSSVAVAAPAGTESVSTPGTAAGVTVAAFLGAVSVTTPGAVERHRRCVPGH